MQDVHFVCYSKISSVKQNVLHLDFFSNLLLCQRSQMGTVFKFIEYP